MVDYPDWPIGGDPDARIIPLLVSSLVSTGPNRLLYNLTDVDYRVLAAPELETSVSLYALERDPETPVATVLRHVPEDAARTGHVPRLGRPRLCR